MTFQFRPAVRENTPSEWRTIPSYPLYEASSEGQIRRVGALIPLKPCRRKRSQKYLFVTPSVDGTKTNCSVHTLVCEAFHGPRISSKHHAAHDDGDPQNNRPGNLMWKTPIENEADKRRHGTLQEGSSHHAARFSEAEITEIRRRYLALPRSPSGHVKAGYRAAMAAEFQVNSTYLWHLVKMNWRNV